MWPDLKLPPINLWTVWGKVMKDRRLNDATPSEWDAASKAVLERSKKKTRSEILKKIREVDEKARRNK